MKNFKKNMFLMLCLGATLSSMHAGIVDDFRKAIESNDKAKALELADSVKAYYESAGQPQLFLRYKNNFESKFGQSIEQVKAEIAQAQQAGYVVEDEIDMKQVLENTERVKLDLKSDAERAAIVFEGNRSHKNAIKLLEKIIEAKKFNVEISEVAEQLKKDVLDFVHKKDEIEALKAIMTMQLEEQSTAELNQKQQGLQQEWEVYHEKEINSRDQQWQQELAKKDALLKNLTQYNQQLLRARPGVAGEAEAALRDRITVLEKALEDTNKELLRANVQNRVTLDEKQAELDRLRTENDRCKEELRKLRKTAGELNARIGSLEEQLLEAKE